MNESQTPPSETTKTSASEEIRIGPSTKYWMSLLLSNRWFYLGVAVVLIALIPSVINLPNEVLTYFPLLVRGWMILGATILLGMTILWAATITLTTDYIFDKGQNTLFIRRGIFEKDVNAINLRIIYDCDVHQSPLELVLGAGTLLLKESESHIYRVPFVDQPLEARKAIMANSGVASARMIRTVS